MTKMEFAAKVAEQIDGGEVKVNECANGQKKVGIVVNDGSNIAPCVYIEEAYDRNQTVEDTVKEIKDFLGTLVKPKIDMSGIMDFEKAKENIRVALFNQVTTVPVSVSADAYGFDDLIICPYVRISDEATTKVTPSLIESWGDRKSVV